MADPSPAPRRWLAPVIAVAVIALTVGVNVWVTRRGASLRPPAPVPARPGSGGFSPQPAEPQLPSLPEVPASLSGFVVDSAGLPVPGAEVTAEAEPMAGAATATATGSGSGSGSGDSIAVSAPTAADGRFAIAGLPPGRYKLRVTGPGLLAAELRYVPVPSETTRVVVARQIAIDGRVLDGDAPAPGAHVGVRGDAIGGAIEVVTDGSGAFHVPDLPEGRYQVYAWQQALAARAVRVARLGAGPFVPVDLRLETGAIVVGRVIDRDEGTGLVAAVELRPVGDDQAPRYARAGDDGVFRIEGVPTGRWIADAFAPGYTSPGGVELDAGKGVPELALVVGGTIEGRVLDGDGHPVEGATVRALLGAGSGQPGTEISEAVDRDRLRRYSGRMAAPEGSVNLVPGMAANTADPELLPRGELGVMLGPIPPLPPPGQVAARPATIDLSGGPGADLAGDPPPLAVAPERASIWTTGPDGRYRIRGVPRGKLVVLAQAPGSAEARSKPVVLAGAEVQSNVDIVVSAGTYLVGRVLDQHGAPVVGAQLSAQPDIGASADGFTDALGEYRIGPLAGIVQLHAQAYGHVDVAREVTLVPGRGMQANEQREDLTLEVADATLAGIVEDDRGAPVAAAQLEVLGGPGDGRHAIAAADGTFEIDMLAAGPLRVRVTHPLYPSEDLDATASAGAGAARVHLQLPRGGAIDGVLLDATSGEPLAGVTLAAAGPRNALADAATDKTGRWKLSPLRVGSWKVTAALPGYVTDTRVLDVPASQAPGEVSVRDTRIELARGASIGVTVRDQFGRRVPQAHVVARLADAGSDGSPQAEGDTDASGELRLRDCPAGELDLVATHGDARGSARQTVRHGDEVLGIEVEIR